MTARIAPRFPFTELGFVKLLEAAHATQALVRRLLPIIAWAAVAVILSVIAGFLVLSEIV
jgi:hypothetical protein